MTVDFNFHRTRAGLGVAVDFDFHKACVALGVTVEYTNELPPQRLGCYLDDRQLILIRASLHGPLLTETETHEYVHAWYRDRSAHPTIEWRAWRETARILIDPHAYATAEQISDDPGFIAHELGVTIRVVQAYRKALLRGEILALAA